MKLSICSAAVLLFFAHTVCCVSVVPRDELYAKSGSTATLTCATGVDQENRNVTWMKGDIGSSVPVESLNDSRTSTNFNNLTISDFHHSEHGGMYYCSMEGPATEHYQLSCPTHVQHARIMANNVSIPVMTKIVSFTINSTAALECNVPPSWPLAHIYWERNGIRLDIEGDPRFSLLPSGNLYIIGVIEDDQAHYRCSATNPITMTTRHSKVTYQLTVTAPPSNFTAPVFTIIPVDTVAITGSRVVIECLGHAHLKPELEWIIIHGRHFPKGGRVLPTGALQFDPVTSEDAGTYRCHLSNSVSITYIQISLEVKEPPSLSSAPQPRFELPVDGAIATNNSIITCTASGSAPLEVLLVHNGRVIREESLSEGIGVREIILTHSVEEEGYYQCFAKNDYGCQQWTTLATHTPSLPTTTESPTSTLGTSVEESSEPFTTSTDKPSNETTVTPGIFTSTSEAVVKTETTEAPLNASSEGEPTTSQGETNTTTSQEGPTVPVEGEPVTSEGPSTTCCIGEGETTTNIEGPTTQEPVSEKITTTTTDSEPVTHPTTTGTRSMTTDTPTQPPLTTPPPPVLDVMTNGDRFSVMVGSSLTLECHVSGGGEGTLVHWSFNGDKLPNVNVEQTHDNDGMPRLSTQLTFDLVESSHAGQYVCEAHSPLHSQTVSAPIQLNVSPLLQPPLNLTVVASQDGRRLAISWLPNPLNAGHTLLGYKLVWDLPSRVVQSAVDSVRPSVREYTTYPVDLSAEYSVLVWAYNTQGDGQPAKAEWSQQSTVSTTEARSECIAMEISPTQVLLEWPDQVGVLEGVVNIIATCQSSQTSSVTQVPVATNSYTLHHLLPSCHYHFRVGVANCYVDTHPGHVDLSTRVHRYDNGSIRLNWFLPEELRELSGGRRGLTIEVRVGGATSGWVPIQPSHAPHIPTHLDTEHSIEFRLRFGDWEGYSIINIPPQTTPTSPTPTTVAMETQPEEAGGHGFQFSEIGLIYGVIFGLLVVACASVVIVILVLKYIQMTRREDDKVTNHREKHMEEFRRMSLQRSSVNSLKKDANFDQQEKKDQF